MKSESARLNSSIMLTLLSHRAIKMFAVSLGLFLANCGPPKSFQTYDQIQLEVPAIELPPAAIDPISMSVGIYYDRWFIDHRLSVFVKSTGVTPYEVKRYVLCKCRKRQA